MDFKTGFCFMLALATFLQVIKNPVQDHLPAGCTKLATSVKGDLVDAKDLVPEDEPVVIVVGAMAHGSVSYSVISQKAACLDYPLKAKCSQSPTENILFGFVFGLINFIDKNTIHSRVVGTLITVIASIFVYPWS